MSQRTSDFLRRHNALLILQRIDKALGLPRKLEVFSYILTIENNANEITHLKERVNKLEECWKCTKSTTTTTTTTTTTITTTTSTMVKPDVAAPKADSRRSLSISPRRFPQRIIKICLWSLIIKTFLVRKKSESIFSFKLSKTGTTWKPHFQSILLKDFMINLGQLRKLIMLDGY